MGLIRYPFYKCMKCNVEIKETSLPIHVPQELPVCSKCQSNKHVDIVLGDENTVLGDEDTVLLRIEEGSVRKNG